MPRGFKSDPALDDAVRASLAAGRTLREAAKECGTNTGVVQRVKKEVDSARRRQVPDDPSGGPSRGPDEAFIRAVVASVMAEVKRRDPPPEVVERPAAKLPVEPRTRIVDLGRRYERIAVLSDLHHPFQDDAAVDCAMAAIRDFAPQLVLLLGDYFDCYSISDHDKEPGRADYLQDEFDAARPTHAKVDDATPGAAKVFLDGNHEFRIARSIARNPGLFKLRSLELPVAADLPKHWMYYPNQTRFKAGSLTFLHGDLRGRGTSTMHAAKGMLDKLRTSCLFGHLHRFQTFHQTGDDGTVRGGFANGHLCDVSKAHYITSPDWQQGFSTIEYDWSAGIFTVTPHLIVRGRHRWNGKTYGRAV